MHDDLYHEQLLEEAKHPHHYGLLTRPTHTSHNDNPSCGDQMQVSLIVHAGKITDVGWEGSGCAISTAAMSLLSDTIIGKTAVDVAQLERADIQALLGLETLALARQSCAEVGLKAVKQALESTTK